jgi:hypothetical protein
MFASIVLMATTNHVSTDIAVMPFLWVVPLALYLLTFIIAFDSPGWYHRTPLAATVLVAVYATAMVHKLGVGTSRIFDAGTPGLVLSSMTYVVDQFAKSPEIYIGTLVFLLINFLTMFAICMVCHGELFRLRPDPRYLTSYYLMISLGGALGGFFVTFVAPQLFLTYLEWQLTLFIATVFAILFVLRAMVDIIFQDHAQKARRPWHYALLAGLVLCVFIPAAVMMLDLVEFLQPEGADARLQVRNFFGTLSVYDRDDDDPRKAFRLIKHGAITHGAQFAHETRRREPTTYYSRKSAVGRVVDYYRRELKGAPMRIGVVGLGAGTMAAYGEKGDSVTFYEINRDMLELSESGRWFTYLKDCRERGAHCDVRMGDARLTLQRELEIASPLLGGDKTTSPPLGDDKSNSPPLGGGVKNSSPLGGEGLGEGGTSSGGRRYHIIVLDAFSGDSVPAHLLTVEAFEMYFKHLSQASDPGGAGAILVHISNRYLNLAPLAFGIARHFGVDAIHIENEDDAKNKIYRSHWVIITPNNRLATDLAKYATPIEHLPTLIWTDSHSSLLDVLK